ncbi:MAG TPA: histidine phosphatase family protein [Abditibacteriaceae bacterium]|jgi:broad specificity phosphatase PhoE
MSYPIDVLPHVFLVRHGEVEGNGGARPTFAGWADKPLTPRGENQAAAVAHRLSRETVGVVQSSDLQRARITAEKIAAPHGLAVAQNRLWREINYGAWEGLGEAEILRDWAKEWHRRVADPETFGPPEGESYSALWARMQPVWNTLLETIESTTEKSGVLVAHNGPIRILLCHVLGVPFSHYRRIDASNCGLSRIEWKLKNHERHFVVRCLNETAHLHDVS